MRKLIEAFQPVVKAAAAAMADLVKTFQPVVQQIAARRDRPAWVTPYGPPPRRRRR
jgi:hypothetical protein